MESDSIELRRYAAIVLKYLWLIALTTILAGGSAYYVSRQMTPTYRATATLKLDLAKDPQGSDLVSMLTAGERLGKTYVAQIRSTKLMGQVAESLGMSLNAQELGDLVGKVSVEQVRDTQLINISVEDANPQVAQGLANKIAEVFIAEIAAEQWARFENNKQNLDDQIADLEARIAEVQKSIASLGDPTAPDNPVLGYDRLEMTRLQTDLSSLQTRYTILLTSAEEFRLAAARYSDNVTLFAPAELPAGPVSPSKMKNTLLGAVVGLMIGLSVTFLREYLDDTLKTSDDVTDTLNLPTLGNVFCIDRVAGLSDALITIRDGKSVAAESYRTLRTNLQFCGIENPGATIVVTSPGPLEGKTTTVANLAVTLALAGKRVILVDADLRRPMLAAMFDVAAPEGLTNLLVSTEALKESDLVATSVENLRIIPSGPIPSNPAELLASSRMAELIRELKRHADMVIFDSPPVLAVTDASVVAHHVDGTLLVVTAGETCREPARKAAEALQRSGAKMLGVVLNKLRRHGRNGYYYYYYYYHRYYRRHGKRNSKT